MRFSYHWLKELTETTASPRELAELLTLRSFEVAVVGRVGNDWALEAKIPTNRISDAASHWGLAREIVALTSGRWKARAGGGIRGGAPSAGPELVKIQLASPALATRYSAAVLEIKTVKSSPKWMAERLITCGSRPLNHVVDVTNYVMLETGQPLHAFDLDQVRGGTMTIREARRGEALTTLDGTRHLLPRGALIIEDRERIIDLAGIMGGENSAVSTKSRRILLQAAVFDPVRIYRTSRALNFSSAASKIYSSGIDPNRTITALTRAIELLNETAGAKRTGGLVDLYPRRIAPVKLLLRKEYANQIIGEELPPTLYRNVLRRLGFATSERKDGWLVEVPTERRDIQREEDLIEEIVRLFGYDKLRAKPLETQPLPSQPNEELEWENRIKDLLVGAGLTEAHVYHFISPSLLDVFGASTQDLLGIENPLNPDTQYLNSHPAHQYLKIIADNLRHENTASVFGIAQGFKRAKNPKPEAPADERKYLVIARAAKAEKDAESFYAVKGALDQLLESLGVADHWYDDALTAAERKRAHALHPYRTAKVMVGDEFLGIVAELHPIVQERLKSKARLVFAELNFEKLWKLARAEAEFRPISKYPAVIRDIAVVVPENIKTDDVEGVIQSAGGELLVDSDLFDYFQDEMLTKRGEKSLAFHLVFQSPERTLTDEEVSRLFRKIVATVKQKGWEVRE